MKKIYTLIPLMILTLGCGGKKVEPVVVDPVSEAPEIVLFKLFVVLSSIE